MTKFSNICELVNDAFRETLAIYNLSDTMSTSTPIEENRLGKTGVHVIAKMGELKQGYQLFNALSANNIDKLANDVFSDVVFREFLLNYSVRLAFKLALIDHSFAKIVVDKILASYTSTYNKNTYKDITNSYCVSDPRFFASFAIDLEYTENVLQSNFWLVALYLMWLS